MNPVDPRQMYPGDYEPETTQSTEPETSEITQSEMD